MGKGDNRRPANVPDEELAERWERTFGSPETLEEWVDDAFRRQEKGEPPPEPFQIRITQEDVDLMESYKKTSQQMYDRVLRGEIL